MAFLGYSARIIVSSSNIPRSVAAWSALGFEVQGESHGRVRLTDGQLLITIMSDQISSPTLAYFTTDVTRLLRQCIDSGISAVDCSNNTDNKVESIRITIPNCCEMYVHEQPSLLMNVPTKEQNPVLSYFDSLVFGTHNIDEIRTWSEKVGYHIQQEWREPNPQLDVTDGLMVLSFRRMKAKQFLSYLADVDQEYIDFLTNACAEHGITFSQVNNELIKLTMPEGTLIMIANDSFGERG